MHLRILVCTEKLEKLA